MQRAPSFYPDPTNQPFHFGATTVTFAQLFAWAQESHCETRHANIDFRPKGKLGSFTSLTMDYSQFFLDAAP
jgi:hypothetical protein